MVTGDTTTASASTTSTPPTYSPAPISNGTYYIGAQSFGVVIDFKSASGNLTSSNFTGDLSQQWEITSGPASPAYAFRNIRYNSYISCVTPPKLFYLSQSQEPCVFYARGSNGGYLFSPDPRLSVFWDVPDVVDVVILERIASATVLILATLNESSSFISSAIAISPTSGGSGPSPTTNPTTITTALATNTAGQSSSGISESDKISLGVGIGIGFPSFVVAFLSAWLVFRSVKRRKNLVRKREVVEVADEGEATTMSTSSSARVEVDGTRMGTDRSSSRHQEIAEKPVQPPG